ncbi:MAG: glucose 1-dehydrogenase [Planctomycetes bacterium]|nr:glucose 1-dehydrogenase [Planctomycetota bacterium]
MSKRFINKTVLITGGTSGMGRATAVALASEGASVVITGRRAAEGNEVLSQLKSLGAKAAFIQGDVTDETHVRDAVAAAVHLGGGLDGAFNNAGVELGGVPITETTVEQYRHVFDVNVLGVLVSLKHELRAMRSGGAIVNNASVAGRVAMAGVGVYVASKHAVIGLTKSAAMDAAPRGIRVNSVSPAAIDTAMFDRFTGNRNPDALAYMTNLHPIGRIGKPEEVSAAVLFLLSAEAGFITGHDLLVDGGLTVP